MTQPQPKPKPPALSIESLRFRYPGASEDVVDIAHFALDPAQQALLVGGSGRGKSTLLQLIAGLLDPTAGTSRVGGRNIHALHGPARDKYRGRNIGMIFQTFNLLRGFTAAENVMAALAFTAHDGDHRALAINALARLGIDRPDADPEQMSVGQQQRIAVARAVVGSPALVLADEPTASLDPDNAATAMDLIQQACTDTGAALLCVSHDPAMRERFARVESLESLMTVPSAGATA